MNSYGERLDKTTVRFERLLPGPIERVWQYISDGEKRAKWLAGGSTELAVDGVVNLEFHNASLSPLPDDPPPNKYCGLPEKMFFFRPHHALQSSDSAGPYVGSGRRLFRA